MQPTKMKMCCCSCLIKHTILPCKLNLKFAKEKPPTLIFDLYVHLFPCSYDEEADKVNQYQRLILEGLEKIEIGKKLNSKEKWELL